MCCCKRNRLQGGRAGRAAQCGTSLSCPSAAAVQQCSGAAHMPNGHERQEPAEEKRARWAVYQGLACACCRTAPLRCRAAAFKKRAEPSLQPPRQLLQSGACCCEAAAGALQSAPPCQGSRGSLQRPAGWQYQQRRHQPASDRPPEQQRCHGLCVRFCTAEQTKNKQGAL